MKHQFVIYKNSKTVIWLQMWWLLLYGFFRDILGIPGAVSYFIDVLNLLLFLNGLYKKKILTTSGKYYRSCWIWFIVFLVFTIFGAVGSDGGVLLYIWGARNTFRYYLFVISCATLLQREDVFDIIHFFKQAFVVNALLCVLEYALGFSGDFIGGSFGVSQGGNGYLNLLLVIVTAIYVSEYLEKQIRFLNLGVFLFLLICFFLMALSELKVYLFELPLIILISMILSKFSFRKIFIVIACFIGIYLGVTMLGYFFETSGFDFFTIDSINEYIGDRGYTNSGDLSRFNAVPQLYERFFEGNTWKKIFGIGLGNASYSSYEFFTSVFYKQYNLMHYAWFSDAMIFIETGIVGLTLYEAFFVKMFLASKESLKHMSIIYQDDSYDIPLKVVCIVSLMCIFNTFYNSSLTMDAGYLAYFILTIPILLDRDLEEEYLLYDYGGEDYDNQFG